MIILVAKYAVFLIALGAVLVWFFAERRDKVTMLVAGVVTLVLAGIAIRLAAYTWADPRPFVVDGHAPLIPHAADNGFPSDHATIGAAIAAAVVAWRRWLGAGLFLIAIAVAAARVAAHIHHIPDVVAGLAVGSFCAAIGVLVARRAVAFLPSRWSGSQATES